MTETDGEDQELELFPVDVDFEGSPQALAQGSSILETEKMRGK